MTDECTFDVHCHSWWSYDGFASVDSLHSWQRERGIAVYARTEHDSLDGWQRLEGWTASRGPAVVTGVELSCSIDGCDLGILGIGLDPFDTALNSVLEAEAALDAEELGDWCSHVHRKYRVDMRRVFQDWADSLFPEFPEKGRRYIPEWIRKRLLVAAGISATPSDAAQMHQEIMSRLSRRELPSAALMIRLVHDAGGLAVLEHPEHEFQVTHADSLRRLGLDGIEAYSGHLSKTEREQWVSFCAATGLIVTAGSDHHGVRGDWGRTGLPCNHPAEALSVFLERLRRTHWGEGHPDACESAAPVCSL